MESTRVAGDAVETREVHTFGSGFRFSFQVSSHFLFAFVRRTRRVACAMADDAPAFVDLHAAARAGDLDALGARVAAGDEVDGRDKHKRTALHMAAWAGQVSLQIRAPPSLLFVVA